MSTVQGPRSDAVSRGPREAIAERPLPLPDQDTAEFWSGCARHQLLMQRCARCKQFRFYPRPMCPHCNSMESEWVRMSGRGRVYSWVVARPPVLPAFQSLVPYAVVLVALDEDPELRLVGNLLDCPLEEIRMDMPVEVTFQEVAEGVTLPQWRPAR